MPLRFGKLTANFCLLKLHLSSYIKVKNIRNHGPHEINGLHVWAKQISYDWNFTPLYITKLSILHIIYTYGKPIQKLKRLKFCNTYIFHTRYPRGPQIIYIYIYNSTIYIFYQYNGLSQQNSNFIFLKWH